MSRCTLDPDVQTQLSHTGLSPSLAGFPKTVLLTSFDHLFSPNPECMHSGLASFHFARRYFENRCFFLFLWLLRCFSSPGSLPYTMYSCMDDRLPCRVSPFRYPRITAYLRLPVAFRSLSRLSSALSAKASTLRSSLLDRFARSFGLACPTF